ncbi:MAG: lipase maturation factor family protein [Myxococcota bacterium]|nr:lipase maturation factor family protein [Myxococcota bacterium]
MLLGWLQLLENLDAALVAGFASRFFGVVFFIHFLSALPQMLPLIGSHGIEPVHALFSAVKRDLGIPRGFFKFPSIFWVSTADWMVVLVPVLGLIAASSIIVGALGSYTAWAFFVVWLCALSLQTANTNLFWFPWDNLVTEVALVGLLLHPLELLPSMEAAEPPSQLVLLMYGWLLFRVMFGMGLAKFRRWDERTREGTYLYHFLEWQPFPCAPSALLRELPMWVHKVGLVSLWCVEIVLPFFVFGDSEFRLVAMVAFIGLQLFIWWTGNFGTFNLSTIGLCLLLPIGLDGGELVASAETWGLSEYLAVLYIAGSLPFLLVTTTWTGGSWMYRPSMYKPHSSLQKPLELYLAFLRMVSPFRIWNSYGVFIPRGNVPHQVAVLQATTDGETWSDLEPKWLSCDVARKPPRFAPHHPRLDHWLFYQGFGLASLRVACLTGMNPYYIHPHCLTEKLIQKLLAGDPTAWSLLRAGKVPETLPKAIRHSAWHYHMTSAVERRETGHWWRRELVAVGPPIEPKITGPHHGVRDSFDPLLLNRLALVDDVLLCVGSEDLRSFEMLNAHPVQKLGGQKVARSRSVIETITHPVSSDGNTVLTWTGASFEPVEVQALVSHDLAHDADDGSRGRKSIWRRA